MATLRFSILPARQTARKTYLIYFPPEPDTRDHRTASQRDAGTQPRRQADEARPPESLSQRGDTQRLRQVRRTSLRLMAIRRVIDYTRNPDRFTLDILAG